MWRDVQYGVRMLAKTPGVTLICLLTLGLGMGANTAIFSVIHSVLLRSLPYEEADRLVVLTEWSEQVPEMSFSMANMKDVRDRNTVFESVVGSNGANFVLSGEGGEAERVNARQATSGLFRTLRISPVLGRAFTPEEDMPGSERVVMLSEGFWERRFGRDPHVLGRTLNLSGYAFTVVGVMPKSLHGSWKAVDVFTPLLRLEDRIGGESQRGNHPGIYVVARLKPAVTVEQARADVVGLAKRLAEEHPDTNARQNMTVQPLLEAVVGDLRPALMLLLGAVAFVLLIACANVANLLLARAASRQKEIAVRMAIGAQRGRLLRQLLTESALLSLAGGVLGLLLAFWGVRALVASLPANIPRADEIRVDAPVFAFTAGIALFTGLLFGLAPAWKVSGTHVSDPLREGSRGSVGPGHQRMRNGLVVAEISLALILLVGAGLLLRSFFRVLHADPGFRSAGVLTAGVPFPIARYNDAPQKAASAERVLEALQALPGVDGAAVTNPLLGGWQSSFSVEGRPEPAPGQRPSADIARVSPAYFSVMGLRVLQGRTFDVRDRSGAPPVAMIDETFARAHWPGESPLGKRVKFGGHGDATQEWMEVVGVVGHVKNYGVDEESRVEMYLPYLQNPAGSSFSLVVHTSGNPANLASAVRKAVATVDPELPTYAVRTLDELVADRSAQRRLAAVLISVFAGLALLLAAVGIYGVMSYAVVQRTQEIGIRMALGAERDHILRMVLRHGSIMTAAGVTIGLVAALGLARLIASQLFETSTADPPTFSVVPVLLATVAIMASYLPARRATRVDPLIALRRE